MANNPTNDADQPNIILIINHDLGQHLGCYGVSTVDSPNIDNLANEGIRFENCFSAAPTCSPSRAAMMTGQYPHCNGVMGLVQQNFAWDMKDSEQHLSSLMGGSGYQTNLIGIQHATREPNAIFHNIIESKQENCNSIADTAIEFLRNQEESDQPFYLQLGFHEPHRKVGSESGFGSVKYRTDRVEIPEYIIEDEEAREEFAAYQGVIHKVDAAIGNVIDKLKEDNLKNNTLVIFTADHGIPFPGAKASAYDPGIEIPLIIWWPNGDVGMGEIHDEMVLNIDVLPTLFDILNIKLPDNIQGRSFAGLLTGGQYESRENIFGELTYHGYCDPRRWVRTEEYKLIANFTSTFSFMGRPTHQTWQPKSKPKYRNPILDFGTPIELYDIRVDPLEANNLASDPDYESICRNLLYELHSWMKKTDDPLLDGIPQPPIYEMTLTALSEGRVPDSIEEISTWRE